MLFRRLILAVLVFIGTAAAPAMAQTAGLASRDHPIPNQPGPQATDFNIVTAIDVSDSIDRHEEWLQMTGLARGVVDPAFLQRITEGQEQRIGFMAFSWSSGGDVNVVVPWTVIANAEDAQRVAAIFNSVPPIDRSGQGGYGAPGVVWVNSGLTDISEAVTAALRLAMESPFTGRRSVINILSDGVSNNGQDPRIVRDQAIRSGVTINGIVFGGRRDLPGYFRQNIIGGPGAFLMEVQHPYDLPKALEKKFWQDIIAGLPAPAAG